MSVKKLLKFLLNRFGYEISLTSSPAWFNDQKMIVGDVDEPVIFDVGAHFGQTSLRYNRLFNNCKIYSFEPFKDSFETLNETVKYQRNIETFNTALGNKVGEVDFHININSVTNSILPTAKEGPITWGTNALDTTEIIKVASTTIDSFIDTKGIHKIDILKIDAQGTEYYIIEGAVKAIDQNKIKIISLEIITLPTYQNQKYLDEVLRLLRLNGFSLYNIYNLNYDSFGALRQIDAIFISSKFQK